MPRINQFSADEPSRGIVPAIEAVARDKGEPDRTETQYELNQRLNHRTHTPDLLCVSLPFIKIWWQAKLTVESWNYRSSELLLNNLVTKKSSGGFPTTVRLLAGTSGKFASFTRFCWFLDIKLKCSNYCLVNIFLRGLKSGGKDPLTICELL